jgi:hypothetical protein
MASIALFALVCAATAEDFATEQIHGFGDKKNRINILIMGDGWAEADLPKFKTAVNTLKVGMLEADPLKQYQNFLTITRVDVKSASSGITYEFRWQGEYGPTGGTTNSRAGEPGVPAPAAAPFTPPTSWSGLTIVGGAPATYHSTDTNKFFRRGPVLSTYFQTWNTSSRKDGDFSVVANPQRTVWLKDDFTTMTEDTQYDCSKMLKKIQDTNKALPRDVVILLINEKKRGGAALPGTICLTDNPAAVKVLNHELGHALALLDDEYVEDGNEPSQASIPTEDKLAANVTRESDKTKVKWKHWVGFEGIDAPVVGALYRSAGVYRPKQDCMMRVSGDPFCAVCKEEGVRRMLTRVSLVDKHTPEAEELQLYTGASQTFKIECVGPQVNKFEADWLFDGKPVKGTKRETAQGPVFEVTLGADVLVAGTHDVAIVVNDKTSLIKDAKETDNAYKRMPSEYTWKVSVKDKGLFTRLLDWLFGD